MKPMFIAFIIGMLLLIGAVILLGSNIGLSPMWIAVIALALAGVAILVGSVKMSKVGTNNTTVVHK